MDFPDLPASAGVYQLRHVLTGDTYIGSAYNMRVRVSCHFSEMKAGRHSEAVRNLVKEWGCHFDVSVLELTTDAERLRAESRWIAKCKPTLNRRGFSEKSLIKPAKPGTVLLCSRIKPDLLSALQELADADERTLSYMVEKALREFVERHGKAKAKGK